MVINIITMFLLDIFLSQVMNRVWHNNNSAPDPLNVDEHHFYIFGHDEQPYDTNKVSINAIFSFYLLLNGIIPLNLSVNTYLAKFC